MRVISKLKKIMKFIKYTLTLNKKENRTSLINIPKNV